MGDGIRQLAIYDTRAEESGASTLAPGNTRSLSTASKGRDGGFTARHPALVTSTGTIQLRPEDEAGISDGEFLDLARAALAP
jgi:hypothetical protein